MVLIIDDKKIYRVKCKKCGKEFYALEIRRKKAVCFDCAKNKHLCSEVTVILKSEMFKNK